jgi:hypothetical protein
MRSTEAGQKAGRIKYRRLIRRGMGIIKRRTRMRWEDTSCPLLKVILGEFRICDRIADGFPWTFDAIWSAQRSTTFDPNLPFVARGLGRPFICLIDRDMVMDLSRLEVDKEHLRQPTINPNNNSRKEC